jgi:3-oxoacyl-[acyl-carrier-protein] synthase II
MTRAVAVTGIGAVTPLGVGSGPLIERWCEGEDGFAADGLGRCDSFDPAEFLSRREIRRADRFVQFAIVAAEEAIRQAGWDDAVPFDPFRVACVVGSGIGGVATMEAQLGIYRERGPTACSPLSIPLSIANAAAAAVAMRWGLRGHSSAAVSACAAGADAIANGVRVIRSGEADAAVVGGSESAISDFCRTAFDHMHATSPSGVCRPFDARRDGFVMGEGAGMIVLEDEAAAQARGAYILARLSGIGTTSDAFHLAAPDPSGAGASQAIKLALADAELTPADVVYVNAHGTGTPLNDVSETQALKNALGGRAYEIPVSSTKSAIGHLLGGAGAVDAVVTIAALRARMAPPTLNYEVPDETLDLDYVVNGSVELCCEDVAVPTAISNAFGFGGHNIVLAFTADNGREQTNGQ